MRLEHWEQLLGEFIAEHRDRPFEWGQWDCALFGTACAAAITGEDRAAAFRGQYNDRAGSARALREFGDGTLIRTMNRLFERKLVGMAQRGDLIMAGTSIGVCFGAAGFFVGEEGEHEGLVTLPRADWSRAWSV